MKAVALLSGGLDSSLAAKLVLSLGIEVLGISFSSPFFSSEQAKRAGEEIGIQTKEVSISEPLLEVLKQPKYGFGKNLNPCIDCHLLMIKFAGKYMEEEGADFLVTGEVIGSRPKSQNRMALETIERESGYKGFILRPLSARLLEETIPEKMGWIDRAQLLGLHGKSRRAQLELANRLNIKRFSQPAGGCLLTDPSYSNRLRDLLLFGEPTLNDVELLRIGRHFRVKKDTKFILGRNKEENKRLFSLAQPTDILFWVVGKKKGPVGLLRGEATDSVKLKSASLCARYSDVGYGEKATVRIGKDYVKIAKQGTIPKEVLML